MMSKLKARAIIEILGSPEEHVKKTMQMILEKIRQYPDTKIVSEKMFPAEKMKDKPLWSTFAELEMEVKQVQTLTGFCFDFMPSSLEIMEPEALALQHHAISDFLNDLLARLHQYDMVLKNVHAENILLKRKIEGQKH
ncbi:hypothetical protein HYS50_00900 [Candidatus Woesearchaeota archaeon]|nr:hypothetical protein [Candidatus Woesearchaeota archaeon]